MTNKTEPALLIADALDCFTNEAMNAAINRQDLTAIAVADALSAGFGGLAHRLRENFTVAAPSGDEVERVAMALCQSALVGQLCPCRESGSFKCADEFPGKQAKAAIAAIDRSEVERLRAALVVSEVAMSKFIAAVDKYNEKHGEFIVGLPLFRLARAVGTARQALKGTPA